MNVFTRCEVCRAEGTPTWMSGSGQQGLYQTSGYWALPSGWDMAFGVNLCGDCVRRAKSAVTALIKPPAQP